jgi:glycosyltransferase involved in cell wall biosynthesis
VFTVSLLRLGKIVVFFHGWDQKTEQRIRNNVVWRFLFSRVYQKSSVILVLGSTFRTSLVGLGFDPERIQLVTTMFDGKHLTSDERVTTGNKTNILFLSRFVREKGVYEIVDAFSLVSERYPEARLILAGDGPEMDQLKKHVEELGLDGLVSMPGYLVDPEKARVLMESDLFVFPTYYGEGCPVALLEAMAAGQAVITTGAGGISDIFRDEENGILLASITKDSIASAMDTLLGDDRLRADIGNRNRAYALANFEASIVTKKMELLYEQVRSS